MSSTLWWLVLGLLIGWLIEWVIDWLYWRRRQASTADAQAVQQADAEHARMRDSLASARADNLRLQVELDAATALAQQRQATIEAFAEHRAHAGAGDTQGTTSSKESYPPVALSTDNAGDKAARFATVQLSREGRESLELPAEQAAVSSSPTDDAELLRERAVAQPAAGRRDPLIDINGIGPAYERKLFDAGVSTFEGLAALTPEQVRAIIAPQRWQEIDPAAWIAEARQLAQKQAEP